MWLIACIISSKYVAVALLIGWACQKAKALIRLYATSVRYKGPPFDGTERENIEQNIQIFDATCNERICSPIGILVPAVRSANGHLGEKLLNLLNLCQKLLAR